MELAEVNNHDAAKRLFDRYSIPYEIITSGENKGKLRVKTVWSGDVDHAQSIMDAVRRAIPALCDHAVVFRDANDNVIITFSPYALLKPGKYKIDGMNGVEVDVEAEVMEYNMVDALLCSVKALRVDLCTNLVYHQSFRQLHHFSEANRESANRISSFISALE